MTKSLETHNFLYSEDKHGQLGASNGDTSYGVQIQQATNIVYLADSGYNN